MAFKLTQKQKEAMAVMSGRATHVLLRGGARSGKTFLIIRAIVLRALKASNSRHAVLRFRFNHCKQSIVLDTFPKVMRLCFPDVTYNVDKTDWYASLPNGSEIWFGGLDDKQRTEKILGMEFVTIYLNESSQISKGARDMVVTRLAQLCIVDLDKMSDKGCPLKPRFFLDCNPPSRLHWTCKLFIEKRDPETKQLLVNPDDYDSFQINPKDNADNITKEYIATLEALPARLQKRFLHGEFADATVNSLFPGSTIDRWRVMDGTLPDMQRIVIGVDPSGAADGEQETATHDAVGVVAVGLGTDGIAYVLEDCTCNGGPKLWGKVAANVFDRLDADVIVGETNYGGGMVQFVIKAAHPRAPFKMVTASRGKVVRAEPFSQLYDDGKVRHVGFFWELEEEIQAFTTSGFQGDESPNRADALIWALTELFRGIVQPRHDNIPAHALPVFAPLCSDMGY